jgi:FkbM family methyltransferase
MKNYIYRLINNLGYKIENKKNARRRDLKFLSKFDCIQNRNLLYRALKFVKIINEFFPDLKITDHPKGCLFTFSEVTIFVESPEEIFIISEVFVDRDYHFSISESAVVIDIGANIGISSLFFSTMTGVEKIYSFEPVLDTYNQAKYNFSLNDKINKVVQINNEGLGKNNRSEVFIFNKDMKGNTGVRGDLSPSYSSKDHVFSEVTVSICDASEKISAITNENLGKKIVVKMDCEGAEYEIFENLVANNCLIRIDVFMIEWHDKGPKQIEDVLKNNNFCFFSRNLGPNSGMICAYKK